jgi:hypothetical protein
MYNLGPAALVFLALPVSAQVGRCSLFPKTATRAASEVPQLLAYLRATSGHTWICDLEALKRIKFLSRQNIPDRESWADALIPFLDFSSCEPGTERWCNGSLRDTKLPAYDALESIRPASALPALLDIIGAAKSSPSARVRALDLVFEIFDSGGDPVSSTTKGLQALIDASRASADPERAARLRTAAEQMGKGCVGDLKAKCDAILAEGR